MLVFMLVNECSRILLCFADLLFSEGQVTISFPEALVGVRSNVRAVCLCPLCYCTRIPSVSFF